MLDDAGVAARFAPDGDSLADALAANWEVVDLFVVDLALVSPRLASRLAGERVLAFGDVANVAVVLAAERAEFIPDAADDAALLAAIHALIASSSAGVADLSDRSANRINLLGAEAARIAEALARLNGPPVVLPPIDPVRLRADIRARRLRDQFFPSDLFGEPAWDMLLDLALAAVERRDVAVSSLCIAAAVPTTTALRWIRTLCDGGLFERRDDPRDARRAFIDLSAQGQAAMARYLAAAG